MCKTNKEVEGEGAVTEGLTRKGEREEETTTTGEQDDAETARPEVNRQPVE